LFDLLILFLPTNSIEFFVVNISGILLRLTLIYKIFGYVYASNFTECPKPEILKPCKCVVNSIFCEGDDPINLKTIFHQISSTLESGKKHFESFFLTNKAVAELEESVFEDILFDAIHIEETQNLSSIHTKAFTQTQSYIQEIRIYNTSLKNSPPDHDIFAAISSMENLEELTIGYSLIDEIPENAFQPINGTKNKLTQIFLMNNKISKIGNNAFGNLTYLNEIDLENNKLDHIPEKAFNFSDSSANSTLLLYLIKCSLNDSSFEKGAFNNFDRPTMLYLNYFDQSNNITFLDQHIFEPFFSANNNNGIELNTIDCKDCRSFWLIKLQKFPSQLSQIKCSDGKQISDKSNFPKCAELV
jgi:Leucine-rich repeat (LRR) protein